MFIDEIKKYNIILASQSPRRVALLQGLGLDFVHIKLTEIDETYPTDLYKNKIPVYIAKKKSDSYTQSLDNDDILITVDTIVWCRGELFGKPKSRNDAVRMLKSISNNVHEVLTGVCLRSANKQHEFFVSSIVYFKELTDAEIDFYIDNYHPYDKAGAYGIQEWIGFIGLERIEGSYFNVMGLPVQRLYIELGKFVMQE